MGWTRGSPPCPGHGNIRWADDIVFMVVVRRVGLQGTELAKAQVGTIRLKLLKVAARVVTSVRRVVLHLSSAYPYQALFRLLVARLTPI